MNRGEREQMTVEYRLQVGGRIGPDWLEWFAADRIESDGSDTTLYVRVADQAELYGRLRRIHDLNLTLLAVRRLGGR